MAKKREKPRYNVVSYFCGCGGLDLGFRGDFVCYGEHYKKLPFDIIQAYDNNPPSLETYNRYFGKHGICADLATLDPAKIAQADLLIGGFPCQEFSSCGPLGGLNSERGQLYKALIRYMKKHKPKVAIGENVVNLERMEDGKVLQKIVKDLAGNNEYKVEVWRLFAPDYGLPQRRTRLFFICVRKDLPGFPQKPEAKFINAHRGIEWAIGDLVGVSDESVSNQSQFFGASRAKKGNGQGDESNHKDKPAYTIRANPKSRVQFHYSLKRRLTVRECARVQSFPDDFIFTHAKTTSISQIGNAVPPLLAHCVAQKISEYMDRLKEAL